MKWIPPSLLALALFLCAAAPARAEESGEMSVEELEQIIAEGGDAFQKLVAEQNEAAMEFLNQDPITPEELQKAIEGDPEVQARLFSKLLALAWNQALQPIHLQALMAIVDFRYHYAQHEGLNDLRVRIDEPMTTMALQQMPMKFRLLWKHPDRSKGKIEGLPELSGPAAAILDQAANGITELRHMMFDQPLLEQAKNCFVSAVPNLRVSTGEKIALNWMRVPFVIELLLMSLDLEAEEAFKVVRISPGADAEAMATDLHISHIAGVNVRLGVPRFNCARFIHAPTLGQFGIPKNLVWCKQNFPHMNYDVGVPFSIPASLTLRVYLPFLGSRGPVNLLFLHSEISPLTAMLRFSEHRVNEGIADSELVTQEADLSQDLPGPANLPEPGDLQIPVLTADGLPPVPEVPDIDFRVADTDLDLEALLQMRRRIVAEAKQGNASAANGLARDFTRTLLGGEDAGSGQIVVRHRPSPADAVVRSGSEAGTGGAARDGETGRTGGGKGANDGGSGTRGSSLGAAARLPVLPGMPGQGEINRRGRRVVKEDPRKVAADFLADLGKLHPGTDIAAQANRGSGFLRLRIGGTGSGTAGGVGRTGGKERTGTDAESSSAAERLFREAQEREQQKRIPEAIQLYHAVVTRYPKTSFAPPSRERISLLTAVPEVQEQMQNPAQFHLDLGKARLEAGAVRPAESKFRFVIRQWPVTPQADEARRLLDGLAADRASGGDTGAIGQASDDGFGSADPAAELYRAARVHDEAARHAEALRDYHALVSDFPESSYAAPAQERIDALWGDERIRQVIEDQAAILMSRGATAAEAGRFGEALPMFERVVEEYPLSRHVPDARVESNRIVERLEYDRKRASEK